MVTVVTFTSAYHWANWMILTLTIEEEQKEERSQRRADDGTDPEKRKSTMEDTAATHHHHHHDASTCKCSNVTKQPTRNAV
ncbi:unnamed protein product [Sphagnum troendelagicum]